MDPRQWNPETALRLYIHDYLVRRNHRETARIFQEEAHIPRGRRLPFDDSPGEFLSDWFSIFYDTYSASSQRPPINGVTPQISEAPPSLSIRQERHHQGFEHGSRGMNTLQHFQQHQQQMILPREPPLLHLGGNPSPYGFQMASNQPIMLNPSNVPHGFQMTLNQQIILNPSNVPHGFLGDPNAPFMHMRRTPSSDPSANVIRHVQRLDMQRPQPRVSKFPRTANSFQPDPFGIPNAGAYAAGQNSLNRPLIQNSRLMPNMNPMLTNGEQVLWQPTLRANPLPPHRQGLWLPALQPPMQHSHLGLPTSNVASMASDRNQRSALQSQTNLVTVNVRTEYEFQTIGEGMQALYPEAEWSTTDGDLAPPSPSRSSSRTPTILETNHKQDCDGDGESVLASGPLEDMVDPNQVSLEGQMEKVIIGDADGNKGVESSEENSTDENEDDKNDARMDPERNNGPDAQQV